MPQPFLPLSDVWHRTHSSEVLEHGHVGIDFFFLKTPWSLEPGKVYGILWVLNGDKDEVESE